MNDKPPLKERIKSRVIEFVTHRLFLKAFNLILKLVLGAVMAAWAGAVAKVPWIQEIIDPRTLTEWAAYFLAIWIPVWVARATGEPVEELQDQLRDAGIPIGRTDRRWGPRTQAGLERAINDPKIMVKRARIINTNPD